MMGLLQWLDRMEARLMTALVGDLPTITPTLPMPAPVVEPAPVEAALMHTCTKACFQLRA